MSNYKVGDKFEIEIDSEFVDENDNELYRIKGFNSLVFDEKGLNKLKRIGEHQNIKGVKASELPVDTVVLCWDDSDDDKVKRHFSMLHAGYLYAYSGGLTSDRYGKLYAWKHMILEDGTVVLPE